MNDITFIVQEADEGGYYAESVGAGIFDEGKTIDELKENPEAVMAPHGTPG